MPETSVKILTASEQLWLRLNEWVAWLPMIGVALLVAGVFVLLARWAGGWQWLYTRLTTNSFLQNIYKQICQAIFVIIGILLALEILNATALVGAVLGTAGVAGLALGFAFRDIVENYLAGILLSLRQPFGPNDLVEVSGHTGKVIKLTSRATILLTSDGNHVRIPNATVFKENLVNYSRNPMRRFDFVVGVGSEEDLSAAQALGVEVLDTMKSTSDEYKPLALLEPPGDSSIGICFYAWVDQEQADYAKSKSEAIRLVTKALADAEIDMPEPIHRVRVDQFNKTLASLTITESDTKSDADETNAVASINTRRNTASAAQEGNQNGQANLDDSVIIKEPEKKRQETVTEEQDTSVDKTIDQQVAEERAKAESDLLSEDAKQE